MTPEQPASTEAAGRTSQITLADGRRLAYAEYGDPGGTAVLFHTGTYFSRLLPAPPALPSGLRLISIDRSGIGESDDVAHRSFAQSASDTNALADKLGLKSYAVLGWSSGSSHAMACAAHSPERVRKLGLVAALPPWSRPGALKDVERSWVMMATASNLSNRFPLLTPLVVSQIRKSVLSPKKIFKLIALTAPDKLIADKYRDGIIASYNEALKPGPEGIVKDIMTFVRPWDFDMAAIRSETVVWHATQDRICPHTAEYVLATVPGSRQVTLDGQGHLAIFDHWSEILTEFTA